MTMSRAAKDYRNKLLRERYRRDPKFRKKEIERVEKYWERRAAAAAAEQEQPAADHQAE